MGIRTPLRKLFDFDFLKELENTPSYYSCLKAMSKAALKGELKMEKQK